jgi:AraC family transcriptional regulator
MNQPLYATIKKVIPREVTGGGTRIMNTNPYIRFHHAGDITVNPGHQLKSRQLSDYELVYFPMGTNTVYETASFGESQLTKPCIFITRPLETHAYRFDTSVPTRHLFIHFDVQHKDLYERYSTLNQTNHSSIISLNEESLIPHLMKQLLYYFHSKPIRWQLNTEMLFLSVLEEIEVALANGNGPIVESNSIPVPIHFAMQYIENHIETKIDIDHLAEMSGWTHEHFTRTFQRHVGQPPREWINKRRINHAAQLLLQRTDSARQIALEMGFKDEYYFHRLFRRLMGMTSLQYRKRYGDPKLKELAPIEGGSRFYPLNHFFVLDKPDA